MPIEGHDHSAQTVDEQITLQYGQRAHWFVGDTTQSQRDERNNYERVENDRAKNRAGRTREAA